MKSSKGNCLDSIEYKATTNTKQREKNALGSTHAVNCIDSCSV